MSFFGTILWILDVTWVRGSQPVVSARSGYSKEGVFVTDSTWF